MPFDGSSYALLERLVIDMDFIDLVVGFPQLTWSEFACSLGAIVAWKLVADQIERMITYRARIWLADRLIRLAVVIRPA